ncbi:Uncharacterised protein [[Clostridium] sordellii]|uniref:SIR2 family NAD-dependent protein deacylase n=1 Tax=Paraclostridium sordellii TaxID=1505 RepID=UPI0005DC06A3|nr:SIR2 family protein [Paeniclostridium sordellii]MBX9180202.1 SIR2 family protein [Paeniclostridium sordellii]CEO10612.1 Uncharacterised protein [[Clostridium] sordellii] [Paeniclostridium sordellii]
MNESISRELVFEKIFNSYNYGNLGMFIGAGFSKSIMKSESQQALGWFELVKSTSEKLDIEFPNSEDIIGVSLPEVATSLCKSLSIKNDITYNEAKELFKEKICELSNWIPGEEQTNKVREILSFINPSWIITTNYDLVLETILTGMCKSLRPDNYFSSPRGIIPIYHIHGTRLDSKSIIITQEDYTPLFRPNEYRQSKLAMTIRESTTLVLGYGLGDINVLSALDWSKNIYDKEAEYPHEIIQAVWIQNPKEYAYRDENGNLILEIDSIENFFNELVDYLKDKDIEYNTKLKELQELIDLLSCDDEKSVEKFINNKEFRIELLEKVSEFEYNMMYTYIEFFIRCMNKVWEETKHYGAFDAYDKYLVILLDIIINYDYEKMPPRLFQIIAENLNKVLPYVSRRSNRYVCGDSWRATDTWHREKHKINETMIRQLYCYSENNYLLILQGLTKDLLEEELRENDLPWRCS